MESEKMADKGRITGNRNISSIGLISLPKEFGLMFLLRRASVVLTTAVLVITMLSGTAFAARGGGPGRSKVYVPAKMIKG